MNRFNRPILFFGLSLIGLLAIFALQHRWIQAAKKLTEEQFTNRSQMALCAAVEQVESDCQFEKNMQCGPTGDECVFTTWTPEKQIVELEKAMRKSLAFQGINLPFELSIENEVETEQAYCCSLTPLDVSEDQKLALIFPTKQAYVKSKLRWLTYLSALILVIVGILFALANYTIYKLNLILRFNKRFHNDVAHELRTPLSNIKLALNFLTSGKTINGLSAKDIVANEVDKMMLHNERIYICLL